jgi:hypothetical protein
VPSCQWTPRVPSFDPSTPTPNSPVPKPSMPASVHFEFAGADAYAASHLVLPSQLSRVAQRRPAAGTVVSNRNSIPLHPSQALDGVCRANTRNRALRPHHLIGGVFALCCDAPAQMILQRVGSMVLGYGFRATPCWHSHDRHTRLGRAVPARYAQAIQAIQALSALREPLLSSISCSAASSGAFWLSSLLHGRAICSQQLVKLARP